MRRRFVQEAPARWRRSAMRGAMASLAGAAAGAVACGGTYQPSACDAPHLRCDGVCIDPSQDRRHCGACAAECAETETCEEGQCVAFCGAGTVLCGEVCVQTDFDPAHCGGCDQACAAGAVCGGGQCIEVCGAGMVSCDGRCVDTEIDPDHCGECSRPCSEGELCSSGVCVLTCPGGTAECSGRCADLAWDPEACGACEMACAPGQVCSEGACGDECTGGTERCGDQCVFIDADAEHCGACENACQPGEVCVDGDCQDSCGESGSQCGDQCVDLRFDSANCGACGTSCDGDRACWRGQCLAPVLSGDTVGEFEIHVGAYQLPSLPAISDFAEDGTLFVGAGDRFFSFNADVGWTRIEGMDDVPARGGFAAVSGMLYIALERSVVRYDVAGQTTATFGTFAVASSGTQTVSDEAGGVFFLSSGGRVIRYDTVARAMEPDNSTGFEDYIPRLAWDTWSARLYLAPRMDDDRLVEYDPATGNVDELPRPPNDAIGPMFCTDRSGHIYTRGDAGSEIWQYTVWDQQWRHIGDAPFSLHPWAACVVTGQRRLFIYSEGQLASIELAESGG